VSRVGYLLVALFVAGVVAPVAWADDTASVPAAEVVHDFGVAIQGAVVRHAFQIRNDGADALRIAEVTSPCGCTVATVADPLIAPGGEVDVDVSFDTGGFRGRKTKTVFVHTEGLGASVHALTLTGEVTAAVVVDPPVLYLGRVHPGGEASGALRVLSTSGAPLDLTAVVDGANSVVAAVVEPVSGAGAAERRIVVRVQAGIGRGAFSELVHVRINRPQALEVDVPVIGSLVRDMLVRPTHLTLGGRGRRGGPAEVVVQNVGLDPVAVSGVRAPVLPLDYTVRTIRPGYEYRITLGQLPSDTLGGDGMLRIYTTHPTESELLVPVSSGRRADPG
jgi:hypothetical protein